jgi:hypothetical protein
MKASGHCVFGAVRAEVATPNPSVGACHCGGPLMAVGLFGESAE